MGSLPGRLERADAEALLAKLGEARQALITAERRLRRHCVHAKGMEAVRADIDDLARLITGDPTYFHLKAPSASPHMRRDRE